MRTYNPKSITVTVDGFVITGFADASFVTSMKLENDFTEYVGAKGEVSLAENANKTGEITIILQSTSPSNAILNNLAKGTRTFTTNIVAPNGDNVGGNECRIRKTPDVDYSDAINTRTYVIFVGDYTHVYK